MPRPSTTSIPGRSPRKWGSLGDAVIAVLAAAGTDLRMMDVNREIERLLGPSVARSSVKNSLARRCYGDESPLERVAPGRYRLRSRI
jgi:hypothetical protein